NLHDMLREISRTITMMRCNMLSQYHWPYADNWPCRCGRFLCPCHLPAYWDMRKLIRQKRNLGVFGY
ncbi:MAG: hypothetical protein V3V88_04050, partial [Dehalococcoidia bacterium]